MYKVSGELFSCDISQILAKLPSREGDIEIQIKLCKIIFTVSFFLIAVHSPNPCLLFGKMSL